MEKTNPSKIHESLAILRLLNTELTEIISLFDDADLKCNEENNQTNYIRYYVFYGRIILHTDCFIDEYKILKSLVAKDYNTAKLDKLIKPLNQRLSKWAHLDRYRNIYFAHNFRDKKSNNRFIFFDDYIHSLDVPTSHYDAKLIAKIIDLMFHEIADFFNDEMFLATLFYCRSENCNDEFRKKLFEKSIKSEAEYSIEVDKLKDILIEIKRNY